MNILFVSLMKTSRLNENVWLSRKYVEQIQSGL